MDYQNIINRLLSNDYYQVKREINKLINDSSFMQMIIRIDNPLAFDRFVKMCEYKIDTTILHEKRNLYIEKKLLNMTSDTNIDDRWITEYIINYFFQDNYYNFMTNFFQMTTYLQSTKKKLVSNDNIKLYNRFKELRNLDFEAKIALFKEFNQDNNLMELFYDDMNAVREDSHKGLVASAIKLSPNSEIYNKDFSRRLGVDVYNLDGEKFFGFIRCFNIKRNDLRDHENYIYSKIRRLGYSFSYIGDQNIGTIDYDGEYVTLLYDNIDYKDIMYVHHGDISARCMEKQDDYLSSKENELVTPEDLVANTNSYNEIYIKGSNNGIKPTALVCYSRISGNEIAFAKKYNLSILVINKEKYKQGKKFDDDFVSYSYVI